MGCFTRHTKATRLVHVGFALSVSCFVQASATCHQVMRLFIKNVKRDMTDAPDWKGAPKIKIDEEAKRRWMKSTQRLHAAQDDAAQAPAIARLRCRLLPTHGGGNILGSFVSSCWAVKCLRLINGRRSLKVAQMHGLAWVGGGHADLR